MSSSSPLAQTTLARVQTGIPYVVVVGQLLLIGLVTPGIDGQLPLVGVVIGEGLLAGLLSAGLAQTRQPEAGVIGFLVAGLVLGAGSLVVGKTTTALWPVAAVLVGSVITGAYILYRVELLRLGLTGGDRR